ncbi:MAG: hypothetical protein K2X69_06580, partial [Silvanigrellaceae bacterium]|nr:hypothetical protein [Silvanigrellaceae bacterium]
MKNVFTYSLIGISISLISCSKNNSTKKNTNETAEFTPVEDNTPPRTPADGNKDKPINEDDFTQVQSERKLNGIYVSIEETNQEKFHLY